LVVVPVAFSRRDPPLDLDSEEVAEGITATESTTFALAVAVIMLAEQTLLNAAVLTTDITASDAALAGIVFNVFLITRAPLQLFQAVQTSLLPHLTGLDATEGHDAFARAVRITVLVIGAFAGAVAIGLLAIGPWVMSHVFGQDYDDGRVGLALLGVGMGFHLMAGTFNQAKLAKGEAVATCVKWISVAVVFVVWMLVPIVDGELLRAEIGYAAATAILAALLVRQ
jgi:O-antigen/teichoic acid export membrane protein